MNMHSWKHGLAVTVLGFTALGIISYFIYSLNALFHLPGVPGLAAQAAGALAFVGLVFWSIYTLLFEEEE